MRWVYDFGLAYSLADDGRDLERRLGHRFAEAFTAVWRGDAENDPLNRLVLLAGLPWREVAVLRALNRYLRQAGTPFSQDYMVDVMTQHPKIARRLLRLFHARLSPGRHRRDRRRRHRRDRRRRSTGCSSLDEDRILRSLFPVVTAILRTNYYQRDADGLPKPYLSVKLDPALVPNLPLPRPMFEIWVYSPRMEGVHLRGGTRRPRRHPLVGPARGLPYRDPRPAQGADGQERRDRAGRRQGRLRRQAAAGRARGARRRGASPATAG